jgi:hypothetical protein
MNTMKVQASALLESIEVQQQQGILPTNDKTLNSDMAMLNQIAQQPPPPNRF